MSWGWFSRGITCFRTEASDRLSGALTGLIFPPGCETARALFEKDGRFRPFPPAGESGGFQIRSGSCRAKILGRRSKQLYGAAGREHY